MKLTKKKLRILIAEELNNVLREGGLAGHVIELTDGTASEAEISASWPDGVMHNGKNVFQTFYKGRAMDGAWSYLQRSGYGDGQESYLGYSPSSETFFMGFDAWEDYEDDHGYQQQGDEMSGVVVELADDGGVLDIVIQVPGSMYPAGLKELKRTIPDIIDVRLD